MPAGQIMTIPRRAHLAYGAGGVANGVYLNGISFFLLIYYNQVIGLSPELTGLALAVALLADALSDPLTGFLSDNTRSRLGRRHPYLYLSILPAAVLFWLIWSPPDTFETDNQLFWFLVAVTVGLRLSMSLYDVPHNAMVPELTGDYHERTRLAGIKVSTTWVAGQVMVIAMYLVWLVPTDSVPYGILNQEGYRQAGLFSAAIIALAILASAVGLHRYIPRLSRSAHVCTYRPGAFFRQLVAALRVPSLRAILFSAAAYAIAFGISAALWTYLMSYYWELSSDQIALILFSNLVGAGIAAVTFRLRVTRQEKKRVALELMALSTLIAALPYLLRHFDLLPANGSDLLIALLFGHGVIQVGLVVWLSAVTTSMTADVVEAGQLDSGYQSEGIVTSVSTFVAKAGTAGGLALSGLLLAAIDFPEQAGTAALDAALIADLGLTYMGVSTLLYLLSFVFLLFYRIDRAEQQRLRDALAGRGA